MAGKGILLQRTYRYQGKLPHTLYDNVMILYSCVIHALMFLKRICFPPCPHGLQYRVFEIAMLFQRGAACFALYLFPIGKGETVALFPVATIVPRWTPIQWAGPTEENVVRCCNTHGFQTRSIREFVSVVPESGPPKADQDISKSSTETSRKFGYEIAILTSHTRYCNYLVVQNKYKLSSSCT